MEKELRNIVTALGNYNDIPTSISSPVLVTTLISGLTITKSADKSIWADGSLTYTITIDNQTTVSYTEPKVTDILDAELVEFVDGSVTIDDQKATSEQYTYDTTTNTLTVNLTDLAPSETKTITFQVTKKS